LFFNPIGLASPIDLLIIAVALFVLLFVSSLFFNEKPQQSSAGYLLAGWTGCEALGWVFWPFFLILNACLFTVDTLVKMGMFTVSSWDDVHLMLLLPTIWWTISVWRCSFNTTLIVWVACARWLTISVYFEYALKLLIRMTTHVYFLAVMSCCWIMAAAFKRNDPIH